MLPPTGIYTTPAAMNWSSPNTFWYLNPLPATSFGSSLDVGRATPVVRSARSCRWSSASPTSADLFVCGKLLDDADRVRFGVVRGIIVLLLLCDTRRHAAAPSASLSVGLPVLRGEWGRRFDRNSYDLVQFGNEVAIAVCNLFTAPIRQRLDMPTRRPPRGEVTRIAIFGYAERQWMSSFYAKATHCVLLCRTSSCGLAYAPGPWLAASPAAVSALLACRLYHGQS